MKNNNYTYTNSTCCGTCSNDDNGYQYILEELKDIRARTDKVIDILEKRIEKDKIIDEALTCDCDCSSDDTIDDELVKAIEETLAGEKTLSELIEIYKKSNKDVIKENTKVTPTTRITYPYRPWTTYF